MKRTAHCLGGLLLTALCTPAPVAQADLDEITARGVLKVLAYFDARRPEFFSKDPGAPGFDAEILAGFARLHRLKLEVVDTPGGSDTRIAALREGKGDVVAGRLAVLEERRGAIDFTVEVFPARFVIVTRKPTPRVTTIEGLRQHKVGTVRASRALVELIEAANVPPARVDDSFREPSDFLEGLRSGRVTAVVWGIEAALPAQRDDPAVDLGAFIGRPGSLAYGLRKQDRRLREALDSFITNLRKTPTWNRLAVKYFGPSALSILKIARDEPAGP